MLEEGLQQPVDAVFDWLSEEPIAAASLGQVYRGKLRDELGGAEVAVKVQRPGSLESAALDIFVMRRSAVLFSQIPGMSDKWASALDDWAVRFFQEMDYELEAHNTMTFKRHMAGLEGVRVATVYPQLTSRRVIVTEWIEVRAAHGRDLGHGGNEDLAAWCWGERDSVGGACVLACVRRASGWRTAALRTCGRCAPRCSTAT